MDDQRPEVGGAEHIEPSLRKPLRWDGGHALVFFVLAALVSLLLGLALFEPLGFYGSVLLSEVVAFAVVPIVLAFFFDTGWKTWTSAAQVGAKFWWWLLVAVVSFAVAQSNLPVLIDRIWPMPEEQFEFYRTYLAAGSVSKLLLLVLVAAIIPGICEEIAFRGTIQTGLRRSFGPKHAIIWGGGLFAILHLNPWTFLGLWSFGCLLGYLRERTTSLFPSIAAHVLNNSLALATFALQSPEDWTSPPEFIPWYLAASAAIVLVVSVRQLHRHTSDPSAPQRDSTDQTEPDLPAEVI